MSKNQQQCMIGHGISVTLVATKGGIVVVENTLTSMTWLDFLDECLGSGHSSPYLAAAAACRFGVDWREVVVFLFQSERTF